MTNSKDMIEACRLVELAHVALIAGNPWQAARFALEAAQKFRDLADRQPAAPAPVTLTTGSTPPHPSNALTSSNPTPTHNRHITPTVRDTDTW